MFKKKHASAELLDSRGVARDFVALHVHMHRIKASPNTPARVRSFVSGMFGEKAAWNEMTLKFASGMVKEQQYIDSVEFTADLIQGLADLDLVFVSMAGSVPELGRTFLFKSQSTRPEGCTCPCTCGARNNDAAFDTL